MVPFLLLLHANESVIAGDVFVEKMREHRITSARGFMGSSSCAGIAIDSGGGPNNRPGNLSPS